MDKSDLKRLVAIFFSWRILLFVFLFLGITYLPLQENFLGGGMQNYLKNPWLWSWVNFDGEHFLSIARMGYQPLTYFFFPVFPMAIKFISNIGGFKTPELLAYTGLLVSHLSFFVALFGLWKLTLLDHKKDIAWIAIYLLILFPTSFYFGSYYSESIFLALSVWSFYFARKKNWVLAGILGAFLTATRVVGIVIFPALLVEAYLQGKRFDYKKILGLLLIPAGLFIYMYFLKIETGDPLEFFTSVEIFGQQREAGFVLLPQVFYRYFFKIIPNLNYDYFPAVFTTFLEISTALIFLGLTIMSFLKQRLSYAVFIALGYLIPTFSGSFSSLPRYVVILFPAFILSAVYIKNAKKSTRYFIYLLLFATLGVATALFVRGYWLA